MTNNISELIEQIGQKNYILNSIGRSKNSEKEMIRKLEVELDGLLYQYYKRLKCS